MSTESAKNITMANQTIPPMANQTTTNQTQSRRATVPATVKVIQPDFYSVIDNVNAPSEQLRPMTLLKYMMQ